MSRRDSASATAGPLVFEQRKIIKIPRIFKCPHKAVLKRLSRRLSARAIARCDMQIKRRAKAKFLRGYRRPSRLPGALEHWRSREHTPWRTQAASCTVYCTRTRTYQYNSTRTSILYKYTLVFFGLLSQSVALISCFSIYILISNYWFL